MATAVKFCWHRPAQGNSRTSQCSEGRYALSHRGAGWHPPLPLRRHIREETRCPSTGHARQPRRSQEVSRMKDEPIWIDKPEVLVVHSMQLAEHGGPDGIRDESLLDSALAKPRNVFAYSDSLDLPRLAASYAFGIALVVSEGFLLLNGLRVVCQPEEKYLTFLHLADGSISEDELTAWFARHAIAL
jgi:death-on-curing protein